MTPEYSLFPKSVQIIRSSGDNNERLQDSHTDLEASRTAYGCMGIGGRWGEPMTTDERKAAIDVVAAAFEHGINFFDHADVTPSDGRRRCSPRRCACWAPRKDMIIQSKCGIRFAGDPTPAIRVVTTSATSISPARPRRACAACRPTPWTSCYSTGPRR